MVGVSASVNLPLHHKVQKFSSGTSLPRWSRKKGRETVVVVVVVCLAITLTYVSNFDNFGQKCYGESEKSKDALFSHLT